MKKQLKTTVMAIALLATVTGAFASDIVNAISGKAQTNYTWQRYDRSTGLPIGSPFVDSESNVRSTYGCQDDTEQVCAVGTSTLGSLTIYYNEL